MNNNKIILFKRGFNQLSEREKSLIGGSSGAVPGIMSQNWSMTILEPEVWQLPVLTETDSLSSWGLFNYSCGFKIQVSWIFGAVWVIYLDCKSSYTKRLRRELSRIIKCSSVRQILSDNMGAAQTQKGCYSTAETTEKIMPFLSPSTSSPSPLPAPHI